MPKTDLIITNLGDKFVDLRNKLPGDCYNWSWSRPLSQVNYLAIHHSATVDTKTPEDIANIHINNSWGGIGYHFLISLDGTVYYVGDISTARANVANLNEQVLGICLIGNFTQGQIPSRGQLDSAHKLCEFFINDYSDLSNLNSWDRVRGHKELPNQSTNCPGDNWEIWRIQIVEGVDQTPESNISYEVKDGKEIQLKSQIDNLQASLGLVNQQLILMKETLAEREAEIVKLKSTRIAGQENTSSFINDFAKKS